jgi:glycosyltransferase involved in cell wall biosynthesis
VDLFLFFAAGPTWNMHVTIVTETYFPQVNGVSRTLGELARSLAENGDRVQLIHPNYGAAARREEVHTVRSVALPFYKELRLPLPPFGSVHRAIDSFRPEIIHIATEATLGWSVLQFARARGLPVVSSFHTNFGQYSGHYGVGWARGVICRYLRWFHNRARETYVPSETTIRELERLGFERLVLWKRGVDSVLFRPDRPGRLEVRRRLGWSDEDVVITSVGRVATEKNVDYLADALSIVAAQRSDVRFLLVGDGPSRPALERRTRAFARWSGYRQGEELADHYAASDIFALTSLTETFGNVVLEAMASGLPVVALRAGGVGETIQPGSTGELVEPTEAPGRFAAALLELVEGHDRRRAMATAARNYARLQSWDIVMAALRDRYRSVIEVEAGRLAECPAAR